MLFLLGCSSTTTGDAPVDGGDAGTNDGKHALVTQEKQTKRLAPDAGAQADAGADGGIPADAGPSDGGARVPSGDEDCAESAAEYVRGKAPPVYAEHQRASTITDRANVPSGTYVFVLHCVNFSDPCRFTLDLSATY